MEPDRKFCAFIYSNSSAEIRNQFFKKLSEYKRVDSPGCVFRNMPRFGTACLQSDLFHAEKIEFLKDYKFIIAFENVSSPGYTTEKIYHAMAAGCIPIYRGNPLVHRDFNPKSFLNFHRYGSMDKLIDRIVEIDNNDDMYTKMARQPWYPDNKLTPYVDDDLYMKRFTQIFGE